MRRPPHSPRWWNRGRERLRVGAAEAAVSPIPSPRCHKPRMFRATFAAVRGKAVPPGAGDSCHAGPGARERSPPGAGERSSADSSPCGRERPPPGAFPPGRARESAVGERSLPRGGQRCARESGPRRTAESSLDAVPPGRASCVRDRSVPRRAGGSGLRWAWGRAARVPPVSNWPWTASRGPCGLVATGTYVATVRFLSIPPSRRSSRGSKEQNISTQTEQRRLNAQFAYINGSRARPFNRD
jgi:hypothetical protein